MNAWPLKIFLLATIIGFSSPGFSEEVKRINVNSASLNDLTHLPGIGPKKAKAIVFFRERRPFTRASQLLKIKGIGRKTLKKLRPLIVVQEPVEELVLLDKGKIELQSKD